MTQIVQMLYSHVNALVAVGAYIGYIGIVFYIVIKQNGRHCSIFELLHPFIVKSKTYQKMRHNSHSLIYMYHIFLLPEAEV